MVEGLERRWLPAVDFRFNDTVLVSHVPNYSVVQATLARVEATLEGLIAPDVNAVFDIQLQATQSFAQARPTKPRPPVQFPRLGWRETNFYDIRQGTNSAQRNLTVMEVEVETSALEGLWISPDAPTSEADGIDFYTDLLRSVLVGLAFNGVGLGSAPQEGDTEIGGIAIGTPFDRALAAQGTAWAFAGTRTLDLAGSAVPLSSATLEQIATSNLAVRVGENEVQPSGDAFPIYGYFLDLDGDLMDEELPAGVRREPSALDRAILNDVGPKQFELIVPQTRESEGDSFRAKVAYAGPTPNLTVFFPRDPDGQAISVVVETIAGSAQSNVDYTQFSSVFTVDYQTPSQGAIAFDVVVPTLQDGLAEGDEGLSLVLRSTLPDVVVPLTIADDDSAGFLVTPTTGLTTTEPNGTATFTIRLTGQPTADVTIPLTSSDTSEGMVSPASLTFTTANWDTPQTVTVSGVKDDEDDGDVAYTIVTGPATSADPVYADRNPADVDIVSHDVDTAGIVVVPNVVLTTSEDGDTALIFIRLASRPTADVTIPLSSSDASEGVPDKSSLTFTRANWRTSQQVTVSGVKDAEDDGDVAYSLFVSPAVSADPVYAGMDPRNVDIVNHDADTAGIRVTPTELTTTEDLGDRHAATFNLRLETRPVGDVTFAIRSSDETEGTVDLATITFTAANWDTARTVTVTGVNDKMRDASVAYDVVVEISASADLGYGVGTTRLIRVTNLQALMRAEANYDDDRRADLTVYQTAATGSEGRFVFRPSSSSASTQTEALGGPGVVPVEGDFDGDGRTDFAVVDTAARIQGSDTPNASVWSYVQSSNGLRVDVPFGGPGRLDRPAPADYDGDGKTDIATFRANSDLTPGAAEWFILLSSGAIRVAFGAAGGTDLPAVADYDGDGRADIATFRPVSDLADAAGSADWFVLPSGPNPGYATRRSAFRVTFGAAGNADQPVPADYDGDGRADIAAFRSESDLPDAAGRADWFVLPSGPNPGYSTTVGGFRKTFGDAGAIAAVGDYDADGRPDFAAFDPATGKWAIEGSTSGLSTPIFGPTGSGVVPVLSPLYFRLQATGNLGASTAGGLRVAQAGGARWPDLERWDAAIDGLVDG